MGECVCKIWKQFGRSPLTYRLGAHHERNCPSYQAPPEPAPSYANVCDETPGEGTCALCSSTALCERI